MAKRKLGIPILGTMYQVSIEPIEDHNGAQGLMDGDAKKITVSPSSPDRLGTVVHEVLHAILQEAGLRNVIEHNLEEAIVMALEAGLMRSGLIRKPKVKL